MEKIIAAIKKRLSQFCETTAYAIEQGNWLRVCYNVGIVLLAVCISLAGFLFLLTLLGKMWVSFLGKIIMTLVGTPLVLYVLWLSYKMNQNDLLAKHQKEDGEIDLTVWAEDVYGYVRNAVFLVLRALPENTNIVKPGSLESVETTNPISVRNKFATFNFLAWTCGMVDVGQIKRHLTETIRQLHQAHKLDGIPVELIHINGAYYCPLQVFDVIDYGDSITISIVFASEQTVELIRAHKLLHLENSNQRRNKKRADLYDDEL